MRYQPSSEIFLNWAFCWKNGIMEGVDKLWKVAIKNDDRT